MFGLGFGELVVVAAFFLSIALIFILKRKLPDRMLVGIVLGIVSPIALFYPNDRRGWMYFLGVFVVSLLLANTAGQSLAFLTSAVLTPALNFWRLRRA